MVDLLKMQPRPPARDLRVASHAFENTPRGAELMSAGCRARLDGKCTVQAVAIVAEGETPGSTTPRWLLNAVCGHCARELGITLPPEVA